MNSKESNNILVNNQGELPRQGYLLFFVKTHDPNTKLQLIKDALLVISRFTENNWPEDEVWDNLLPEWFLKKIKSNTIEKIRQNKK